jgi:hypothetical protein
MIIPIILARRHPAASMNAGRTNVKRLTHISVGIKSKVDPAGEREYSVCESLTSCIVKVEVLKLRNPSARPRVP